VRARAIVTSPLAALLSVAAALSCTPDAGNDPVPEALEFDTEATPPRAPQPTGLIVNPSTGLIDFALAGTLLPEDCADSTAVSAAECRFDRYLEALDGFPSVTPAAAPATSALDSDTLTLGDNVVVLAVRDPSNVPEVELGFDDATRALTVRPLPSWSIGETYFIGVRGYDAGVRAASGKPVVGSPTLALIKQEASLTCGAESADAIDEECPAFKLLVQSQPAPLARASLVTLERIRAGYAASGVWEGMAAAGLPKAEIASLWGFPIHSGSVAELDPSVGLVPHVTAADEIRVAVQGEVDPATVTAFVVRETPGSVVLMDLTAAAAGDLVAGFPRIDASYADGAIVISGSQPFTPAHQYGLFMTRAVHDPSGAALVPPPISVLLTSTWLVADDAGKSELSSVADADAVVLEAGRAQLAELFDNPFFQPLTGIVREDLVYCFAFEFQGP
jgi:hypothetical protein